jgi:hypothetical protein
MITVAEIKQILKDNYVVYIKYVRIGNEYRFVLDADWYTPKQSQMVKEGEIPVSAGSFKLYQNRLEWESQWSATLRMGTAPDDDKNLHQIFFGE